TRSASDRQLAGEIARQFTSYPKTLYLVLAALAVLLVLPGIPAWPVFVIAPAGAALALYPQRGRAAADAEAAPGKPDAKSEDGALYEALEVEPFEVKVGQNLATLVGAENSSLMERIGAFRRQYAQDAGFVAPKLRVRDDRRLAANAYEVAVFGVP